MVVAPVRVRRRLLLLLLAVVVLQVVVRVHGLLVVVDRAELLVELLGLANGLVDATNGLAGVVPHVHHVLNAVVVDCVALARAPVRQACRADGG